MRHIMSALALGVLAGCAGNLPPVRVEGPARSIATLAGEWTGEYSSAETGRSGSIYFRLTAANDTARGDVLMIPRSTIPLPADSRVPEAAMRPAPTPLLISFVHVSDNLVSGTLEPYKSPDCGCTLTTVFHGRINGNRIDGDFVSSHSDPTMGPQSGKWWVTRSKDVARK